MEEGVPDAGEEEAQEDGDHAGGVPDPMHRAVVCWLEAGGGGEVGGRPAEVPAPAVPHPPALVA